MTKKLSIALPALPVTLNANNPQFRVAWRNTPTDAVHYGSWTDSSTAYIEAKDTYPTWVQQKRLLLRPKNITLSKAFLNTPRAGSKRSNYDWCRLYEITAFTSMSVMEPKLPPDVMALQLQMFRAACALGQKKK